MAWETLPELPADVQATLEKKAVVAKRLWESGDYDAAQAESLEMWDLIPEPKFGWNAYPQVLTRQSAKQAVNAGRIEDAKHWLKLAVEAYSPLDDNARALLDFISAAIAYREENFDEAYRLWEAVYAFNGKASFRDWPDEYWEFFQERRTGRKAPKTKKSPKGTKMDDDLRSRVNELVAEANRVDHGGDAEKATELFQEAADLLPEPRSSHPEAVNVLGSLGDMLFLQGRFEDALEPLQEALEAPQGVENPFIWLRLGQCQAEVGKTDAARDSLASAFMLEGEEIFEEEDPKYRKLIADLKPAAEK